MGESELNLHYLLIHVSNYTLRGSIQHNDDITKSNLSSRKILAIIPPCKQFSEKGTFCELSQIIWQDLNYKLAFYLTCSTWKSLTLAPLSQKSQAVLFSLKFSLLDHGRQTLMESGQ